MRSSSILYIDLRLFELILGKWRSLHKEILERRRSQPEGVAMEKERDRTSQNKYRRQKDLEITIVKVNSSSKVVKII